jgi:sarcosine/dimethylglycine N-methyltransferase
MSEQSLVATTKSYYDSKDADNFYHTIWGGEDIHVGIYNFEGEKIRTASNRTVATMVEKLPEITTDTKILDLGAGYGGAARYLAKTYGCKVTCLNISEAENERNREKNKEQGLDDLITVTGGNFENTPYEDDSFDIVWSEDSFLHSDKKRKIFEEAARVVKPGGHLIFTDPMQADDCDPSVLGPILERIHLKEMGSVKKYRQYGADNGFEEVQVVEMPDQLTNHYAAVLEELKGREDELREVVSDEYISRMKKGR